MCQVNISGPVRTKILEHVKLSEIPLDIFDHVLRILIDDMHAYSYQLFKANRDPEYFASLTADPLTSTDLSVEEVANNSPTTSVHIY